MKLDILEVRPLNGSNTTGFKGSPRDIHVYNMNPADYKLVMANQNGRKRKKIGPTQSSTYAKRHFTRLAAQKDQTSGTQKVGKSLSNVLESLSEGVADESLGEESSTAEQNAVPSDFFKKVQHIKERKCFVPAEDVVTNMETALSTINSLNETKDMVSSILEEVLSGVLLSAEPQSNPKSKESATALTALNVQSTNDRHDSDTSCDSPAEFSCFRIPTAKRASSSGSQGRRAGRGLSEVDYRSRRRRRFRRRPVVEKLLIRKSVPRNTVPPITLSPAAKDVEEGRNRDTDAICRNLVDDLVEEVLLNSENRPRTVTEDGLSAKKVPPLKIRAIMKKKKKRKRLRHDRDEGRRGIGALDKIVPPLKINMSLVRSFSKSSSSEGTSETENKCPPKDDDGPSKSPVPEKRNSGSPLNRPILVAKKSKPMPLSRKKAMGINYEDRAETDESGCSVSQLFNGNFPHVPLLPLTSRRKVASGGGGNNSKREMWIVDGREWRQPQQSRRGDEISKPTPEPPVFARKSQAEPLVSKSPVLAEAEKSSDGDGSLVMSAIEAIQLERRGERPAPDVWQAIDNLFESNFASFDSALDSDLYEDEDEDATECHEPVATKVGPKKQSFVLVSACDDESVPAVANVGDALRKELKAESANDAISHVIDQILDAVVGDEPPSSKPPPRKGTCKRSSGAFARSAYVKRKRRRRAKSVDKASTASRDNETSTSVVGDLLNDVLDDVVRRMTTTKSGDDLFDSVVASADLARATSRVDGSMVALDSDSSSSNNGFQVCCWNSAK